MIGQLAQGFAEVPALFADAGDGVEKLGEIVVGQLDGVVEALAVLDRVADREEVAASRGASGTLGLAHQGGADIDAGFERDAHPPAERRELFRRDSREAKHAPILPDTTGPRYNSTNSAWFPSPVERERGDNVGRLTHVKTPWDAVMDENLPPPVTVVRPPYHRPARRSPLPVLVGLLAGLVLLAVLPYVAEQFEFAIVRGRERAQAEVARAELAALPEAANRYRLAAKAIEPSVVGIETVRRVGGTPVDDEWSAFFAPPPRIGIGQGSGVIVDATGYIATNFHVVNGAQRIAIRLSDGRTIRDVEVIGTDPASDIAILRIRTTGITAAPWGNSDQLEVGDQVLAVGNPYGLAQTVTAGIISAKDRRFQNTELVMQDFLQTDAAINPGNSGGPLVNLKGEVIGINTAIVGESYRGIGFAIPSRIAEDVYTKLKSGEKVSRGWLGVAMQDLSGDLAEQLKLGEARGVLVADVVRGSPAGKAGIQPGDVIVQWDGKSVTNPNDLRFLVAKTKVGSAVKVTIYRNGQKSELTVTVAERPPQEELGRRPRR